ncbi:hypothetical protein EON64_21325, partial [archaeon]
DGEGEGEGEDSRPSSEPAKESVEEVEEGDLPPSAANQNKRKVAGFRVRAVLKMLASEAGFMINPLIAQSLETLPDDEADVSRAETMLKALGIKSEEKLHTLVQYFFVKKSEQVAEGIGNSNGEVGEGVVDEEGEFESELALLLRNSAEEVTKLKDMIRPEDVIAAVKAYIEDISVEAGPVSTNVHGGTKQTQEEIRIAQKRLASMRNYWTQLSQIVSDDTVSVWKQLETDLMRLRGVLSERAASIDEVDALTQRNAELKKLLNTYLGDAVTNSAFQVPPAQVMKVRDIRGVRASTKSALGGVQRETERFLNSAGGEGNSWQGDKVEKFVLKGKKGGH